MRVIPRKRQTHHSYDDNVEATENLIESEAVEIETEAPSQENEPVEESPRGNEHQTPSFEEE